MDWWGWAPREGAARSHARVSMTGDDTSGRKSPRTPCDLARELPNSTICPRIAKDFVKIGNRSPT